MPTSANLAKTLRASKISRPVDLIFVAFEINERPGSSTENDNSAPPIAIIQSSLPPDEGSGKCFYK